MEGKASSQWSECILATLDAAERRLEMVNKQGAPDYSKMSDKELMQAIREKEN